MGEVEEEGECRRKGFLRYRWARAPESVSSNLCANRADCNNIESEKALGEPRTRIPYDPINERLCRVNQCDSVKP
jgi:hypothetical protein